MNCVRRLMLAAGIAVVLSACGGGGGGDGGSGALTGGSSSGGAASAGGSPTVGSGSGSVAGGGTSPVQGAQAFSAFDPVAVGSSTSNFHSPATARLAGGGNVVLWVQGSQIMARLTDAGGAPIGAVFAVNPGQTRFPGSFSVAPAPDGGFFVAWAFETVPPQTQFSAVTAVQAKRFTSAGDTVWETRVKEGLSHTISGAVAKATAGGFLVGWSSKSVLTAPDQVFLQRLSAEGARIGGEVALGDTTAQSQTSLSVAPLQDGSVLAAWSQRTFVPSDQYSIYTRRLSADLAPLTAATQLPGTASPGAFHMDAEALSNGSAALGWGATSASGVPEVRSAVLGTDGRFASAVQATPAESMVVGVAVAPFGAAGFGVASQILRTGPRFVNASLQLQRFDLSGAPLDALTELVVRQTFRAEANSGAVLDAGNGFGIAGGPDGHVVAAFMRADEQANAYLMGR